MGNLDVNWLKSTSLSLDRDTVSLRTPPPPVQHRDRQSYGVDTREASVGPRSRRRRTGARIEILAGEQPDQVMDFLPIQPHRSGSTVRALKNKNGTARAIPFCDSMPGDYFVSRTDRHSR